MAKKHLPIQFFEKRKDYDDRSTEGGGNSAPPSWVLTGDALTAKSSALTSSVGDVITVFRERQSQEKKLPLVVCTTLEEKAIAKSHRSEITGLYIDENGSNVLGFAGNRCLLTMVSSESTLETMDRALSDTETRAKLISSIVDIEPFYPAVDKFDASIRYYKVRLINYNNYDLNCATKIVFEQQCAAAGIAIEQKTKFTPDMTVYRVCIDSMEQLNLLEDFEGIYTVEKMLPISVTLDTLTSPTTIVAKAPIEGIEYPVVGILDTGIADNPYLSAWKTADSWINGLRTIRQDLSTEYKITADRHITNCETCLSRMEKGVELLEQNENIRIAFQYMNLAMLMQQLHYNLPLQKWEDNGAGDISLVNPVSMPVVTDDSTWHNKEQRVYGKWHPFQLAFVLMNLRAMYDRDCNERGIVDLIWFPTGGGKTEAYLGLSAYTIFIRRLMNKDDKGTAILMRYTLRLLTAQQYERASAMICACDLIRKSHEDLFGKNRITIGLWVGISTTPNKVSGAVKAYEKLYRGEGSNPFVMLKCPWCGAQMGPVQKGKNQWELPGYRKVPLGRRRFGFAFRCRNHQCDFSTEDLPLFVVDESIYEETPTLLLGTVDKFAMLPFRPNAQKIFGYENGVKKTSPDLIIQDELHLISGPLGSMVGHYETLIHELCTTRTASGDIHPKIIASTATISRAKEQCHALYGCDQDDVFQFPPSGLDAGNSFFAEEKRNQNGRRYVGILATGSSSDATTAIRLFASLLYGAKAMRVDSEKDRDPYWTNIGYYNSIRELGQAATWIRADIDQHLDVMYKRRFEDKRYPTKEEYRKNRRYIWRDEELTSRISGSEVTASLANLGIRYPGEVDSEGKIKEHPIDICLATNMISVGLDVSRLGLMTVAGQPKTTSEYIQATSRVGRDAENAPGLVFVLYRPGRPRDKSHYEQFRSYHSRVYCNVEPTSVTPFSAPVRERALHAIMVGMMRLESDDRFNEDPPRFPDDGLIDKVRSVIENRVEDIDSEELDATLNRMEYILQCWEDWNPRKWEPAKNPDWSYADPVPLMYSAGSHPNEAWGSRGIETPTSMRSVDASCEAEVLTNRYVPKEG